MLRSIEIQKDVIIVCTLETGRMFFMMPGDSPEVFQEYRELNESEKKQVDDKMSELWTTKATKDFLERPLAERCAL